MLNYRNYDFAMQTMRSFTEKSFFDILKKYSLHDTTYSFYPPQWGYGWREGADASIKVGECDTIFTMQNYSKYKMNLNTHLSLQLQSGSFWCSESQIVQRNHDGIQVSQHQCNESKYLSKEKASFFSILLRF